MKIIMDRGFPYHEVLGQSIFVVGQESRGKKTFILSLIREYLTYGYRVGFICSKESALAYTEYAQYAQRQKGQLLTVYPTDTAITLKKAKFVGEHSDIIVVQNGDTLIGGGEHAHDVFDCWGKKTKLIEYSLLDSLSKSPIYLETIIYRFDIQVYFKNNKTFVTKTILGETLSGFIESLNERSVIITGNMFTNAHKSVITQWRNFIQQ